MAMHQQCAPPARRCRRAGVDQVGDVRSPARLNGTRRRTRGTTPRIGRRPAARPCPRGRDDAHLGRRRRRPSAVQVERVDVGGAAAGQRGERRRLAVPTPGRTAAAEHEPVVIAVADGRLAILTVRRPRRSVGRGARPARRRGSTPGRRGWPRRRRAPGRRCASVIASTDSSSSATSRWPSRSASSAAIIQSGRDVPRGVTFWATAVHPPLEVGRRAVLLAERGRREHHVGQLRGLGEERVDGDDPAGAGQRPAGEVGVGAVGDRVGAEQDEQSIRPSAAAVRMPMASSRRPGASPSCRAPTTLPRRSAGSTLAPGQAASTARQRRRRPASCRLGQVGPAGDDHDRPGAELVATSCSASARRTVVGRTGLGARCSAMRTGSARSASAPISMIRVVRCSAAWRRRR